VTDFLVLHVFDGSNYFGILKKLLCCIQNGNVTDSDMKIPLLYYLTKICFGLAVDGINLKQTTSKLLS
jgi:hypothetical protein